MKVVFFSSVLNHHQLPICQEMYRILGSQFTFVSCMEMENQRKILGYENYDHTYPFHLKMNADDKSYKKAYDLSQQCEILIAGVIPEKFIFDRLQKNGITFRYSEKILNNERWHLFSPRTIKSVYNHHFRFRKQKYYLLCANSFIANDAKFLRCYENKMFKWGYFPSFINYDITKLLENKNEKKILWVGRYLKLKNPEYVIYTAEHLLKMGNEFLIEMIGTGPEYRNIKRIIKEKRLGKYVVQLDPMPPEKIRKKMEEASVYLFTSNKEEGWGVVLMEAMNSACAVIANNEAGSTNFLVNNYVNGLTYNNDYNAYIKALESIYLGNKLCRVLGEKAYDTIERLWNPKIAAERFIHQSENILENKCLTIFDEGPMSIVE